MNKIICTNLAPSPVGPYSQAILSNDTLYLSGQIGINPDTNSIVEGGIEKETEQVIKNISNVLKEAGFDFEDVIKTTCFLADINDFSTFNQIYAKHFVSNPARSCVQAVLPKGAKVEIEVIAVKNK